MKKNIAVTIEKENEFKELKTDSTHLTHIGRKVAGTVTCHVGGVGIQHCNLVLEITENEKCNS